LAALFFKESSGSIFFCGANLISTRHVITAAHCIWNKGTPIAFTPDEIEVRLGKYNLSIANEQQSLTVNVEAVALHPDWKSDVQSKFDADIAILTLSKNVKFTNAIKPICLPTASADTANEIAGSGIVVSCLR